MYIDFWQGCHCPWNQENALVACNFPYLTPKVRWVAQIQFCFNYLKYYFKLQISVTKFKKRFHQNSLNEASIIAQLFLKMEKLMHSFIHIFLSFHFQLYLKSFSEEIYLFICYYKKEKKFVKNIFCSKYSVVYRNLLAKNVYQ